MTTQKKTMRKTLIGALTALLLLAGVSSQAMAQDTTTDTTTTDTTSTDTTTDTTTSDTTSTDTTTTDTTSTDTTSTATTAADTTASTDTTSTATTAADTTASTDGQGESNLGEAFATDTPNPQPSEPLAAAVADDDAAAAVAAPAASDEVAGESQLAFTGPDTRIIALAILLLGLGLAFMVVSRRQELRLAEV